MNSLQISLKCSLLPFLNDILDVIRAYQPYIEIIQDSENIFIIETQEDDFTYSYRISFKSYEDDFSFKKGGNTLND